MTWWTIPLAVVAMGFIGWLIRTFKKEHDAATKHLQHAHRKQMFRAADEEREVLEKFIKRNPDKVPPPARNESPWNYVRRLADQGYLQVKPWVPSWGAHAFRASSREASTHISVTTTITCWTATVDGVVHRAGQLTLTDGTIACVPLCDPSNFLDVPLDEHPIERCPVITCLGCVTKEG